MAMKRVVVTGFGTVGPLGVGSRYSWERLIKGECGVVKLTEPGTALYSTVFRSTWPTSSCCVLVSNH